MSENAPFLPVTLSFADALSAFKEVANSWYGGCQSREAPAVFWGFFFTSFFFSETLTKSLSESRTCAGHTVPVVSVGTFTSLKAEF